MRKILVFLVLLLSVGFIFAEGQKEEDVVKLSYCFWGSPAENEAIEQALKDFGEANPGIIAEPMYIPGDISGVEYASKMRALAQSGRLPDAGYFRPEQFGEFADFGTFLDLTERIEKENLREAYLPQVWLDVKGRIFGAYTAAECQVMFYNKDVLEKAGVPLPPTDYKEGWSWDQFVEYCKMITTDKNGKHPGEEGFDSEKIVTYGVSYQLWYAMLYPGLWSNGGGIVSRDGTEFLMDKPESIDFIQKLSDLIHKEHVMPYTDPSATAGAGFVPPVMLANGQLGFYFTGQWELLDLAKMDFPLGVGALPILKEPAQMYCSGANVVFKASKHPDEAWKLTKWMMTPDKTLALYTDGLWMPTKSSWYTNQTDLDKWTDNEVHPAGYKGVVVDSMEIAKIDRSGPVKNFLRIWNEAVAPQLDRVWIGEDTAEEAMKKAREIVDSQELLQGAWW